MIVFEIIIILYLIGSMIWGLFHGKEIVSELIENSIRDYIPLTYLDIILAILIAPILIFSIIGYILDRPIINKN